MIDKKEGNQRYPDSFYFFIGGLATLIGFLMAGTFIDRELIVENVFGAFLVFFMVFIIRLLGRLFENWYTK